MQIRIKAPYLVFLGDEPDRLHAKTGVGIAHWRPALCAGQYRLPGSGVDLGLPDMTPAESIAAGAATMIWGVAGVGGTIPAHWVPSLFEAAAAGLDVCAGTHASLRDVPGLAAAARDGGVNLIDVRSPPADLSVGHRRKADRQTPADCGHRLCGRKEIFGALDCPGNDRPRLEGGFPGHRSDRAS